MLKKLNPNFFFAFQAAIWKTVIDSEGKRLFLELRNAEDQSVRFAAIDVLTGQLLWENITIATSEGWTTLHSADSENLVLQVFTDTHNPERKAYYVVEISTPQVVKYVPKLSSEAVDDEKNAKKQNKRIVQPFFYAENQSYFATVADFVVSQGWEKPTGGCEYLEYEDYIIITYYVPTSGKNELANYLLIINQLGEVLLHNCLEASVPQPGLGTFFITHDQLIVVQNKTQLVSYALP